MPNSEITLLPEIISCLNELELLMLEFAADCDLEIMKLQREMYQQRLEKLDA